MNDVIAMRRTDLIDAVTEAVKPLKLRADKLEAALRRMVGLVDRVNNDLLTPDLSQFKAYIEAVELLEWLEADTAAEQK
jgi:hypothetical protein